MPPIAVAETRRGIAEGPGQEGQEAHEFRAEQDVLASKETWSVVAGSMFEAASEEHEVADGWEPSWAESEDRRIRPWARRVVETDGAACSYGHKAWEDTRAREDSVEGNKQKACVRSFRSYAEGSPYTAETAY